jgi:hypothetical protein
MKRWWTRCALGALLLAVVGTGIWYATALNRGRRSPFVIPLIPALITALESARVSSDHPAETVNLPGNTEVWLIAAPYALGAGLASQLSISNSDAAWLIDTNNAHENVLLARIASGHVQEVAVLGSAFDAVPAVVVAPAGGTLTLRWRTGSRPVVIGPSGP